MIVPGAANPFGVVPSGVDIGDNIPYSLMLDSTASQYLTRTFAAGGSQTTWTWSGWVKRGRLAASNTYQVLFGCTGTEGADYTTIQFDNLDRLIVSYVSGGVNQWYATTAQSLRDPSSKYHIGVAFDSTNATQADRLRIYISGVRCTFAASVPVALNATSYINTASPHQIGKYGTSQYFDGLLSKVEFISGQALDPSYFGRFSADVPNFWVPKTYAGTYGTNGFKLDFANGAALGTDVSGNGNNWTLNGGITSANQFTDTPSNNYCVWNGLSKVTTAVLTKGNTVAGASAVAIGTIGMELGASYYWEVSSATAATSAGVYGTAASTLVSIAAGKTYGMRFNSGSGALDYINITDAGAWTSLATGLTSGPYFPYISTAASAVSTLNAGQRPFASAPPAGFKALCTANLPEPSIIRSSSAISHRYETGSSIAASIASDRTSWANWIEIFKRTDTAEDWKIRFSDDAGNMWAFNTNAAKTAWVAPSAGNYLGVALRVGATYGVATGTYSGNNGASQDIAHSLGVPPKAAIIKDESTGNVYFWHTSMTGAAYFTLINSATPPVQSNTNTPFGGSGWLSTTFGVTNNAANNLNASGHTYRYILFADVSGLLRNLGFTGNASADGAFEYVGHRAQIQIEKDLAATTGFYLFSDLIDPYNATASYLLMNTSAGIAAGTGVDIDASGIKHRSTTIANAADAYAAISLARSPFKYSNAR